MQEKEINCNSTSNNAGLSKGKALQEQLTWKFPHIAKVKPGQKEEAFQFCEGYKKFLNDAKTERECTARAAAMLEEAGYQEFEPKRTYRPGDQVYQINRGKALIATTFGTAGLEQGVRMNGAHIDSPRLDLKPNPLYEKQELAYFKTHYYGGLRKYQWVATPLSMHGIVILRDGTEVAVCIGEKPGDPVFCITDLLPHLAAKQNERKLKDGIKGEELNVIAGSLPYPEEELKEPAKLLALQLLNEAYGMTEADFMRAELELVPAHMAVDVGLDRSMIGAYGQDDRVCAYTALMAEIGTKHPVYTTVTVLADKEEIGSEGNTGLNSRFVRDYLEYLAEGAEASGDRVDIKAMMRNSICLSSDVNAAFDPTFSDVYESNNSCYLNKGCVLTKYTGARGKAGSNDAGAELMARIIAMLEENGVCWQTGELGAVDAGGGGTIAKYVAYMNMDVVDLGVPVLSMHSPFELTSKLDVYHTYQAFCAFYHMPLPF